MFFNIKKKNNRMACHGSLQQPTLSDMTQYELNFSLLVEQMLSKIADPAYRQIIVEVGVTRVTVCNNTLAVLWSLN